VIKLNQPSPQQLAEFWEVAEKTAHEPLKQVKPFTTLDMYRMRVILAREEHKTPSGAKNGAKPPNSLKDLRDKLMLAVKLITQKEVTIPLHELAVHQHLARGIKENHRVSESKTHINLEKGRPVLRTVLSVPDSADAYEIKSRLPDAPLNEYLPRDFNITYGVDEGHRIISTHPPHHQKSYTA
jgi:hypothetical protein